MKTAIEFFPNLNALLTANASRKVNKVFEGHFCTSQASGDLEFRGTASYAEAEKLCREGWFEKLEQFKEACSIRPVDQLRRRVVTSPVGYVPHVPNALQGRPDSMIKTVMQKEKTATMDIVVSTCISANISAEQIFKYSAEIVKAISAVEAGGVRVKLILCTDNSTSDVNGKGQISQCFVTLKAPGEKLNLARVYFPLVHPAMQRRIAFRWLETCPAIKSKKFVDGYGCPLRLNKLNLPPQLAGAKFINLSDVVDGCWDAAKILEKL